MQRGGKRVSSLHMYHKHSLHTTALEVRASHGAVTLKDVSWNTSANIELLAGTVHLEMSTDVLGIPNGGARTVTGVELNYTATVGVDACVTAGSLQEPLQTSTTNAVVIRSGVSEGDGMNVSLPLNVRLETGSLAVVALPISASTATSIMPCRSRSALPGPLVRCILHSQGRWANNFHNGSNELVIHG